MATKFRYMGNSVPMTEADMLRYADVPQTTITPGPEAALSAVKQITPNRVPVPELESKVSSAIPDVPLEPGYSPEDFAKATQYGGNNEVMATEWDPETESFKHTPVTTDQYVGSRAETLSKQPDYTGLGDPENDVEMARNILLNKATEGDVPARFQRGVLDSEVTPSVIANWADTSGNIMGIMRNRAKSTLFSMNSPVKSADPDYSNVPLGIKETADLGLLDHKNEISIVYGIANAIAAGQTASYRDREEPVPVDKTGRQMIDSRPVIDVVNSVAHAAQNAFDRMGYDLPMEYIRKMAAATVQGAIHDGGYIQQMDKNGRVVLAAADDMKDNARQMAYLSEALAGDRRRPWVSKTPNRAGSSWMNPGQQFTKNSIIDDKSKASVAEVVKDIMGSVEYIYNQKDIGYKALELQDLKDNAIKDDRGRIKWSNGFRAKEMKVSENDYKTLRDRLDPPKDYNPNDPAQKARFENAKTESAIEEINNKLTALEYDIKNAMSIPDKFYISHVHSVSNQRFIENSAGADSMSSKGGVREMRNFKWQDRVRPLDLFDTARVEHIKAKGMALFKTNPGEERMAAFKRLTPGEQGAIPMMMAAVINYFSSTADPSILDKSIAKNPEAVILSKYNTAIGQRLASLGEGYNNFLKDPKGNTHDNIKQYLGGMPRGEALGNKNLWDDMFNLQTGFSKQETKQSHVPMTYVNFDDGNQNGIFFQALHVGNTSIAKRLGIANPSLKDMREHAASVIPKFLDAGLRDREDKLQGFKEFLREASKVQSFESDLFKAPMMQNSYSMDAGMFFNNVLEFLEKENYSDLGRQYLYGEGKPYTSSTAAADDLNNALEATLRDTINQDFMQIMMSVGRYSALMGQYLEIENVDGDMMILSPTTLLPVEDESKDEMIQHWTDDGEKVALIKRGLKTIDMNTPGGQESIPIATRQSSPNASKGIKAYWSKKDQKYDYFENPIGSALARFLAVMAIQSVDGGAAKLTHLAVNKNTKEGVRPAAFVHDAINSTGSGSLLYRNAYNNIAIPQIINELKHFGKKLEDALSKAERANEQYLETHQWVGIGEDGKFPSMGAFFDERWNKISDDGSYKKYFMKKRGYDLETGEESTPDAKDRAVSAWSKRLSTDKPLLDEAQKLGWKPPGSIDDRTRAMLAVTAGQYKGLRKISSEMLKVRGTENALTPFVNLFKGRVERMKKDLEAEPLIQKHGFWQMSPSVGGGKIKLKPQNFRGDIDESLISDRPSEGRVTAVVKGVPPRATTITSAADLKAHREALALKPKTTKAPKVVPPLQSFQIDNEGKTITSNSKPTAKSGKPYSDTTGW